MAQEIGREIKLLPGQTLCFQDTTSLYVAVGPMPYTLQATDVPLSYSRKTESFASCLDATQGIIQSPVAAEGDYILLGNPVKGNPEKHPDTGKKQGATELEFGTTVIIPGPARFDLFPGQWSEVIHGHRLTTNQYLVIKVIDAKKAQKHWGSAVFEIQVDPSFAETQGKVDHEKKGNILGNLLPGKKKASEVTEEFKETQGKTAVINPGEANPQLITGKEMILKGNAFSFFIPPSGIEVLKDATTGAYIREAVTLQQGQYCILQYEDGVQITVKGPNVVVPLPSQKFFEVGGNKVFVPIELDENSGVYVKVLKVSNFNGKDYKGGEELFITGKEEKFVFPRPGEWQIVETDKQIIHHAASIPPGQGRYVWDERESKVKLVKGPTMFLPNPIFQRFVTRSLPLHLVSLLFPNSQTALEVNSRRLKNEGVKREMGLADFSASSEMYGSARLRSMIDKSYVPGVQPDVSGAPIKAVSFDNNFDGAVVIQLWTNYAIKVTDTSGKSRIEVGPKTVLLEFDELVEVLEFSTGKPKDHNHLLKDVFLVVEGNYVSDIVTAVTKDNVRIQIPLSYRLNFEGDSARWFNVKNYVQLLCDHMRSFIGNLIKQHTIVEIMENHRNILREGILGSKPAEGERSGRKFKENGMRIYDLELREVIIDDKNIEGKLVDNQRAVVDLGLSLQAAERTKEKILSDEKLKREKLLEEDRTAAESVGVRKKSQTRAHELEIQSLNDQLAKAILNLQVSQKENELEDSNAAANLQREKAAADQENAIAKLNLALEIEKLQSEVDATTSKAKAVTPDLIAALTQFADKRLASDMVESLGKLQFTTGENVSMILRNTLEGIGLTGVSKVLGEFIPTLKKE